MGCNNHFVGYFQLLPGKCVGKSGRSLIFQGFCREIPAREAGEGMLLKMEPLSVIDALILLRYTLHRV
jgi:hypothetical protein